MFHCVLVPLISSIYKACQQAQNNKGEIGLHTIFGNFFWFWGQLLVFLINASVSRVCPQRKKMPPITTLRTCTKFECLGSRNAAQCSEEEKRLEYRNRLWTTPSSTLGGVALLVCSNLIAIIAIISISKR